MIQSLTLFWVIRFGLHPILEPAIKQTWICPFLVYDNVFNSRSDILYAFISESHILTMLFCCQLYLDLKTNEIWSTIDNKHARSRVTPVLLLLLFFVNNGCVHTRSYAWGNFESTTNSGKHFNVHVWCQTTEIPDFDYCKSSWGKESTCWRTGIPANNKNIQRTMSHQPDIHMEWSYPLQVDYLN